jgi:phage gp16-like protein
MPIWCVNNSCCANKSFKAQRLTTAALTSRIFKKLEGRWKQAHHHGSIEDPQLLAKYQAAALGKMQ